MRKILTAVLLLALTMTVFSGCSGNDAPLDVTAAGTPNSDVQAAPLNAPDAQTANNAAPPAVAPYEAPASNFDVKKEITVISREDGSGTRSAFIELFGIEVKTDDGGKKDMTTKEAVVANKTDIMMTNVANDLYSIGYISLGSLNDTIKALSIDGVQATVENVKNGSYKIQRPFNIAYKNGVSELALDFVGFILSKEGQIVVADNKYISIDENAPAYAGGGNSGKLVVAGSSSVTPLMEKLREAYLLLNPGVNLEIQMSDSSAGMTSAINGTCDIGMASRALKDSELAELAEVAIAIDGIAVIVNNNNPSDNLTSGQVNEIFTGAVTQWSGLN